MLGPRLEAAMEALFSTRRIDVHVTRRFNHDRGAKKKSFDQPEALSVPKALYEASRVKRFFAINISSLPTFQEGAVLH